MLRILAVHYLPPHVSMLKSLQDSAKPALHSAGLVWDVAGIRTDTKLQVYNAVVLPTLLYGAETWTVYQSHARKLNHFHLACLRRILRIRWQDKVPDTEVLRLAKAMSVFCHLKKIQLRWAGHVVRMPGSRLPNQIFSSELTNGRRNVGAPKRRYKDTLKQSLKAFAIDVSEWEKLSLDRPNWRAALTRGSKTWEADSRPLQKENIARQGQMLPYKLSTLVMSAESVSGRKLDLSAT